MATNFESRKLQVTAASLLLIAYIEHENKNDH